MTLDGAAAQLQSSIMDKQSRVVVVGLGHVGLVDAVAIAEAGFTVQGYDINQEKVNSINGGLSSVPDVSDERMSALRARKQFEATSTASSLSDGDVFIIAVPTLLTEQKSPDVTAVKRVIEELGAHIDRPALIILESTCYPGATQELVPEALATLGLHIDEDYWLGYSPARIDPGNAEWPVTKIPKIVSGITGDSLALTETFYGQIMETIQVASSPRAAEMTKLLENSFRLINIAFIDEMSEVCHELGLNIWEIIDLAATKPFGFTPFYPGPAPGGTCIPIDPFYISWRAREHERHAGFIELAGDIIDQIPQVMLGRIYDVLNQSGVTMKDASILILGASYKRDTFDLSGSPAPPLFKLLEERGARVQYHDPFIHHLPVNGQNYDSVELDSALLREQDAVILLTDHSAINYDEVVHNSRLVIDTRNKLAHFHAPNVHLM